MSASRKSKIKRSAQDDRFRDCGPVSDAIYRRYISSEMCNDGGPGFWLTCDRPFSEAATDLFLDAMRSNHPVPTVQRRARPHALAAP